jgi:hypothetical protein
MSMGLSFQNSIAVIEGLWGIKTPFVRTPKFNISTSKDTANNKMYYKPELSWAILFEFLLFLYFLFGIAAGIYLGDYGLMLFHLMLSLGFAGMIYYSFKPVARHGKGQ